MRTRASAGPSENRERSTISAEPRAIMRPLDPEQVNDYLCGFMDLVLFLA
ncbi:unnamed protein product [Penicillium roqueforti FM164]|uniref:Genomic scaffold, ProqFM164S02 n=1 Tax=Penicillium roqueforti (strain FM164) TaxID=1365484 RepID=W6QL94_PENRF|nr:unnamed protein product [Penicillium roqueforti FM164]